MPSCGREGRYSGAIEMKLATRQSPKRTWPGSLLRWRSAVRRIVYVRNAVCALVGLDFCQQPLPECFQRTVTNVPGGREQIIAAVGRRLIREYLGQQPHMQGILYEKALRDRDTHSLLRRQIRHRRGFELHAMRRIDVVHAG